jgi:two-component system NtrC family response regulator
MTIHSGKKNLRLLLIDDDINLCTVLRHQLMKHGFAVETAYSGREGLRLFSEKDFDIVLTDIQMGDMNGIEVLKQIRRENEQVVVIIITAYGSVDNAVEACRLGADDYLTKPFGQEQLLFVIEKAVRFRQLQEENRQLRTEVTEKYRLGNIIAHSAAMEPVIQMAMQVARSNATVLLTGESGTGKELFARAIHYNSPRASKPLITVNCPSIPDNLLESELFGHVKGAFTGALRDRKGKFELADGGTIFLDEIGDLKESVQAKLLRVLQEHEVERLGGSEVIRVDVRVIAATNKNLEELVKQGRFREDLYYRLNVVPIHIPPLRERKEDIPFLVDTFVRKYAGEQSFTVEPEVYSLMQAYHWPGNVRELENVIERAIVLSHEPRLTAESLPPHIGQPAAALPFELDASLTLEEIERRAIQAALKKSGGNRTRAAQLLGIPRHVLLYRLKKFGME